MGTRYFIEVTCPDCGFHDEEVYYAPTCGFVSWACPKCRCEVDLEKLTGISYEEASNREEVEESVAKALRGIREGLEGENDSVDKPLSPYHYNEGEIWD